MASYIMASGTMQKVGNLLLGPGRCLIPNIVVPCRGFKHPWKSKLPNRRRVPGVGVYAGQISNFDTNDVNYFPLTIPNIPFDLKEEYKPAKLLVIWKRCQMRGIPKWQKMFLEETLKINQKTNRNVPTIVKNTPDMNRKLWHVKYLLKIKPLTFPNGIPTMDDLGATFIRPNGEMIINKKLQVPLEMIENPYFDDRRMDVETIKKISRKWWNAAWDT